MKISYKSMPFVYSKRLIAFTLAEVLITLGIIGIVAEITIPVLYNNFQKQYFASQLEKTYTTLNQAIKQLTNDYGCGNDLKCTGLFEIGTTAQNFGDALVQYIKTSRNCQMNPGQGCFFELVNNQYDGKGAFGSGFDTGTGSYRFVTVDGVSILITDNANGCSTSYGAGPWSQLCGSMWVDVNGLKGPNYRGRDLFRILITNGNNYGQAALAGEQGMFSGSSVYWQDVGSCMPSNQNGSLCGARIMEQGWQMNY